MSYRIFANLLNYDIGENGKKNSGMSVDPLFFSPIGYEMPISNKEKLKPQVVGKLPFFKYKFGDKRWDFSPGLGPIDFDVPLRNFKKSE